MSAEALAAAAADDARRDAEMAAWLAGATASDPPLPSPPSPSLTPGRVRRGGTLHLGARRALFRWAPPATDGHHPPTRGTAAPDR